MQKNLHVALLKYQQKSEGIFHIHPVYAAVQQHVTAEASLYPVSYTLLRQSEKLHCSEWRFTSQVFKLICQSIDL